MYQNQEKQYWKPVPNYGKDYFVNTIGQVKSMISNKILKQAKTPKGYMTVSLSFFGDREKLYVHRLVASAFIPNAENKPQVNHKDGNKTNNCVDNLEWVTPQENMTHAVEKGLMNQRKGPNHKRSKLTCDQVEFIIKEYRSGTYKQRELGQMFGVSRELISKVLNRGIEYYTKK